MVSLFDLYSCMQGKKIPVINKRVDVKKRLKCVTFMGTLGYLKNGVAQPHMRSNTHFNDKKKKGKKRSE